MNIKSWYNSFWLLCKLKSTEKHQPFLSDRKTPNAPSAALLSTAGTGRGRPVRVKLWSTRSYVQAWEKEVSGPWSPAQAASGHGMQRQAGAGSTSSLQPRRVGALCAHGGATEAFSTCRNSKNKDVGQEFEICIFQSGLLGLFQCPTTVRFYSVLSKLTAVLCCILQFLLPNFSMSMKTQWHTPIY